MANFKLVSNAKKLGTVVEHSLTGIESVVVNGSAAIDIIASEGVEALRAWELDQKADREVRAKVRPVMAKMRAIRDLQDEFSEFSKEQQEELAKLLK